MSLPSNVVGGFVQWSSIKVVQKVNETVDRTFSSDQHTSPVFGRHKTIFNKHHLPLQLPPANAPLGPFWPLAHPKDKTPRTQRSAAVQCSEECTDLWSGGTLALTEESRLPCTELTQTTPSTSVLALLQVPDPSFMRQTAHCQLSDQAAQIVSTTTRLKALQ